MVEQKILSESEEMYLVTLRRLCEHCLDTPFPISDIALEMGVKPVSVHQMVNKLADLGLVIYTPYTGVQLTEEGRAISSRILRHRRLWEVFLVKELKMDLGDADRLACQFEHYTPPDVANRLSAFLDNPTVCFHGDPIPQDERAAKKLFEGLPLANLTAGQTSHVMRIEADELTTSFLFNEGIRPGVEVRLVATGQNGDALLESENGRIHISSEMSSAIVVDRPRKTKETFKKEKTMAVPLSDLKVGDRGIIQRMNFKGALRQRLLAMGLVIGETILVKRVAPLGDPIDFVVKGYDLSLRKAEASEILVDPA